MDINQLVQMYLSNEETYESGEIIIEEGAKDNWVYIILEGQAKVTKRTDAGIVTIDKLKKGAITERRLTLTATIDLSGYRQRLVCLAGSRI